MKRYITSLICAAMAAMLLSSCNGISGLEKRLDSLESRVQALTVQMEGLNANVEAIAALMKSGTIRSVSMADGVYTLVLSNGTTITLDQGSVAPSPVVSVDQEGYWMVDYCDGHGSVYILNYASEKINARGDDGVTPVFSVDAAGYWCVSYDSGASSSRLKDVDGNDVKATPDGTVKEQFFTSVDYDQTASVLTLVLKNGTALDIPVITSFLCRIEGLEGTVQKFSQGQTRSWDLTLEGVADVLVYKPAGWEATADQGRLVVTAPILTKASAISCDSARDVSILAISTNGYSAIAKMKVELDDVPPTPSKKATDFYARYNEGKTIVIGGKSFSKAQCGDAVLVEAQSGEADLRPQIHQKKGVFFLQQAEGASFVLPSVTEITGEVVLVNRYDSAAVSLRPDAFIKLKSGKLCIKGISFDLQKIDGGGGSNTNYLMNNANSTDDFTALVLDSCRFENVTKPLLYCPVATTGFKSIVVNGSKFAMKANVQLFNLYKSTVLDVCEELSFENNIVANSQNCTPIQVFQYDQNIVQTGTTWPLNVKFNNNIFYNTPSANGYVKYYRVSSLQMNRNIFHAPSGAAEPAASYCVILYGAEQTGDNMDCSDNLAYGLNGKWNIAHSTSTWKPAANEITKLSESPFDSFDPVKMVYTLKEEYKDYGPRMEAE